MSEGVLYIATGNSFINEAKQSAKSVKKHMPDVEITLITDTGIDNEKKYFDNVELVDSLTKDPGASTLSEDLSPYDRTLFLDTDTIVTQDISEVFDILDEFDLAITMSPGRKTVEGVPEPWREYNTGVFSYKSNSRTSKFFSNWGQEYKEWRAKYDTSANQPSFTKTLFESDIDFFVLPREYNVRIPRVGYIKNDVKILHGHHPRKLSNVAKHFNNKSGSRVYWPNSYYSEKKSHKIREDPTLRYRTEYTIHRFIKSLKNNGARYTTGRIIEEFKKKTSI